MDSLTNRKIFPVPSSSQQGLNVVYGKPLSTHSTIRGHKIKSRDLQPETCFSPHSKSLGILTLDFSVYKTVRFFTVCKLLRLWSFVLFLICGSLLPCTGVLYPPVSAFKHLRPQTLRAQFVVYCLLGTAFSERTWGKNCATDLYSLITGNFNLRLVNILDTQTYLFLKT